MTRFSPTGINGLLRNARHYARVHHSGRRATTLWRVNRKNVIYMEWNPFKILCNIKLTPNFDKWQDAVQLGSMDYYMMHVIMHVFTILDSALPHPDLWTWNDNYREWNPFNLLFNIKWHQTVISDKIQSKLDQWTITWCLSVCTCSPFWTARYLTLTCEHEMLITWNGTLSRYFAIYIDFKLW